MVAPSASTSTMRSPSMTVSPGSAYQTLRFTAPARRSGNRMGVGMNHLVDVITRPDKRPGHHLLEAQHPGLCGDFIKLAGWDEPGHRDVPQGRSQILAKRQNVARCRPQVRENVKEFISSFAEAERQTALGQHPGRFCLDSVKQVKCSLVVGPAAHFL